MAEIFSYLEDEVRDGFYIPSIAKRAWAAELSILRELNRICDKYGLRYFADWGSLLGAVRHRGFIPWDDDLDVCMFRKDLDKLQEVANDELPEGFKLYSFENSDYSWKFIVNIVNAERMTFTPEYLKDHYNFPYMATIDIYVIDNVSGDEEYEEHRREVIKYLLNVADAINEENVTSKDVLGLLSRAKREYGINVANSKNAIEVKRKLYRAVLNIMTEKDGEETDNVCQMIPFGVYQKRLFPRDYYDKAIKIPFENTWISVPIRYDKILKTIKYGDYWKIKMGVGGHGYPYYNAQKELLGLPEGMDYIPSYKFNKDIIGITNEGERFVDGLQGRRDNLAAIEDYKKSRDYQGEFDRETVLFLPFKSEYWNMMKPFYDAECTKDNVDVFVVPLPYFYKEYDGSLMEKMQYDPASYPEDLPVYLIDELDINSMFADRIYIQNPYDEFNMCMSVPPKYYAANIRNLTQKLIYVPWFETSDFEEDNYPQMYNMQYYCTVPGVVLSDEVYVSSNKIRERYINKLIEFGGNDTSDIWENKIRVTPYTKEHIEEDALLIYFSPSVILEYKESLIEKIKKCGSLFRDNAKKIKYIWHIDRFDIDIIREHNEVIYNKLINVISEVSDIVVVDYELKETELVKMCKAYYGDGSYLSRAFVIAHKYVMIENPELQC